MPKYTFIIDPGHGWLRVPLAEIRGLAISSYSFRDANYAYLEEDCDAPLFMRANGLTFNDVVELQVPYFNRNRQRILPRVVTDEILIR